MSLTGLKMTILTIHPAAWEEATGKIKKELNVHQNQCNIQHEPLITGDYIHGDK